MKKLLSVLIQAFIISGISSQTYEQSCHLGVTFEISNNQSWGYGEPVILTVEPNSPADVAGIQPGDIIMEINGAATYLRNYQTIASWLFNESSEITRFTVRNLNTYFKEYELPRLCRPVNAISESDLASSFSFYSIEDTHEREFVLPLKITTNKDVDYSDYHTFSFYPDENPTDLDKRINSQIEASLKEKGLVKTENDPDILIQTYYSYQPNPKYNPQRRVQNKTSARFDTKNQQMVTLPILPGNDMQAENNGQFILELGIRFFDQKYVNPETPTLIWEVNAKEYLSAQYTLEEYTRFHAPLIMMQFPYSNDRTNAKYLVSSKNYYYTGLYFNMNDMKTIVDVDRNSPAYNAGMRQGIVLEKIDDMKLSFTKDDLLNGYKRFITETMEYRDPNTRFTDAKGYPDCMYWKKSEYNKVRKAFENKLYAPVFKYLYGFEKYVSSNTSPSIIMETKLKKYKVIPEIRRYLTIRAL